jgi:hypothetical protein
MLYESRTVVSDRLLAYKKIEYVAQCGRITFVKLSETTLFTADGTVLLILNIKHTGPCAAGNAYFTDFVLSTGTAKTGPFSVFHIE